MPGICVLGSSLVRYRIYRVFHLLFYFSVWFRIVPFFCIGSSFISFSRLVISASGFVFFRLFRSYVFCFIISIVFFSSSFFSFISLSRSFVSVIAVMNFEMSRSSAVIPSNAHSFSVSINLRQKSSGVSVSVCHHMKSSCISASFPVQPFCVISSPRINSVISILYFLFVYCLNLSSHCFGVKIRFPSDVASKFGTSICFVSVAISLFR